MTSGSGAAQHAFPPAARERRQHDAMLQLGWSQLEGLEQRVGLPRRRERGWEPATTPFSGGCGGRCSQAQGRWRPPPACQPGCCPWIARVVEKVGLV